MDNACMLCGFMNDLHQISRSFTATIYQTLAPGLTSLLRNGVIAYVIVTAGLMMTGRGVEQMKKVVWVFIAATAAGTMLHNYNIYFDWIYQPLEDVALSVAKAVLQTTDATRVSTAGAGQSGYAQLIFLVEILVRGVFRFAGELLVGHFNPGRIIAGIILLLPYLFVVGIFTAFMVEALFKFVAIGIAAPLLIAGLPFPFTRAFAGAAFRILIGASMTVIFAAGAMGFTMSSVNKYTSQISSTMNTAGLARLEQKKLVACANGGAGDVTYGLYKENKCKTATAALNKAKKASDEFSVFSPIFFTLVIIGFVSILLHLQSKSLASNISGANDGAGPAAATVAGAKMLLGMGILASGRVGFGPGGIKSSITAGLSSIPGGGSFARHGIIGGGAAAIVNAFRGMGPESGVAGGGWDTKGPGPSYSAGGGMDDKTINKLATAIGSVIKGSQKSTGRNRMGDDYG